MEKTPDGGFIYCGYTGSEANNTDAFLMKVDGNGKMLWYKTYGGIYYDEFKHAIPCVDGGYIAVGTTNSYGKGFTDKTLKQNDYIVKTDADGNELWVKSYLQNTCILGYVMETKNSEIITTGELYSSLSGNRNISVLKLDKNGQLLMGKNYPNWDSIPNVSGRASWNEYPTFLSIANDGSLLIAGTMDKSSRLSEVQHLVTFLMKVEINNLDSIDFFYSYQDYVRDDYYWFNIKPYRNPTVKILNAPDGYFIGTYLELPGSKMVMQVLKTNLAGVVQWQVQHNGLGNAMLYDITENLDGTFILTGLSTNNSMNFSFIDAYESSKIMLMKIDKSGNEIWTHYLGSDNATINIGKCIVQDHSGGWKLAGLTSLSKIGTDKMMMIALDKDGNVHLNK